MNIYQKTLVFTSKILPRNSLSRNAILVVIGDGINFSAVIITSMILARIITVDAMAIYRQVIYLGGLAQSIVEFGLSSSIYRFWNLLDGIGRSTFIKMQITLSMTLGAFASVVLAILAPYLEVWYNNPGLKIALLIACASPLVNIVPLTIRPVMICKGKPLFATFTQLFFSLAMALGIIIPFYFTSNLNIALAVWMSVNFIEVIITLFILQPELKTNAPRWNKKMFIDTWQYLWPIQGGRIPGIITNYTDKIATSVFLSPQQFAAYSLGARELPFVGNIGYSVSSVMIPKLVTYAETKNIDAICALWKKAIKRTAILIYPIIGFSIWFSFPLVNFFYSSNYNESSIPFAVFASISYIRVIEYASLAKAFGRTQLIMKSAVLAAVSMLILSFPMTKLLGIWGMSISVLLAQILSNGFLIINYKKILNKKLNDFYPISFLILLVIISLLSSIFSQILFSSIISVNILDSLLILGFKLIFYMAISFSFYLFILFVLKIIKLSDFMKMLKVFKK